MLQPLTLLST